MEHPHPVDALAHDLRTPLSVIKINLEVLLLNTQLEPEFRENLRTNIQQIDRIAEIINDFQKKNRY